MNREDPGDLVIRLLSEQDRVIEQLDELNSRIETVLAETLAQIKLESNLIEGADQLARAA